MKYALRTNPLSPQGVNNYTALTHGLTMNGLDELMEELTREGSILKTTEVLAVIEAYYKQIRHYLQAGEGYADEWISIRLSMGGIFESENDRYDANRHVINVITTLKGDWKAALRDVQAEYVPVTGPMPKIMRIHDTWTQTDDTTLTPRGLVKIFGEHLKLHNNLPAEGIYFRQLGVEGNVLKATKVHENLPSKLEVTVPNLVPGDYRIEVHNTLSESSTLRVGLSEIVFTIAA